MPARAQDADALVQRLQSKYESIDALRARFTQTLQYPGAETSDSFSGTVTLRDDSYRVETASQTLVTDGTTTWIYSPAEQQVLVNDYREDETAFSLNSFLFDFDERYAVEDIEQAQYDGALHYVVTLSPKSGDSFFEQVRLWLRDRDDVVTRLEIVDVNETKMVYQLDDVELNPAVPADAFTFRPPAGAEVIDLRS